MIAEWSVRKSRYHEGPDCLATVYVANWEGGGKPPGWMEALAKMTPHYSLYWAPVNKPAPQSLEAKGRRRRENLKKRLALEAPLFAEDLFLVELRRDPEYYDASRPEDLGRQENAQDRLDAYNRLEENLRKQKLVAWAEGKGDTGDIKAQGETHARRP